MVDDDPSMLWICDATVSHSRCSWHCISRTRTANKTQECTVWKTVIVEYDDGKVRRLSWEAHWSIVACLVVANRPSWLATACCESVRACRPACACISRTCCMHIAYMHAFYARGARHLPGYRRARAPVSAAFAYVVAERLTFVSISGCAFRTPSVRPYLRYVCLIVWASVTTGSECFLS